MRRQGDGFTTVQYVAVVAMSMLLLVLAGNLLVDIYQRGAIRDALDEGVRSGVPRAADVAQCDAAVHDAVRALAPSLRFDELSCARSGAQMVATARVALPSWLPMLVPPWRLSLRARAEREK